MRYDRYEYHSWRAQDWTQAYSAHRKSVPDSGMVQAGGIFLLFTGAICSLILF